MVGICSLSLFLSSWQWKSLRIGSQVTLERGMYQKEYNIRNRSMFIQFEVSSLHFITYQFTSKCDSDGALLCDSQ